MAQAISSVIGKREADNLRSDFNDLLNTEGCNYGDVEELLLGYGLEMDYLEQLLW